MTYKFARVEYGSIQKYEFQSYDKALSWVQSEIERFKVTNRVVDESKDRSYISYKDGLYEALEMQKVNKGQAMDEYTKCSKCDLSDQEGVFCRCESRNIKIAKERREKGEFYWQPERLNPKDAWIKSIIIDELFDDNGNLKSVCESPNPENK